MFDRRMHKAGCSTTCKSAVQQPPLRAGELLRESLGAQRGHNFTNSSVGPASVTAQVSPQMYHSSAADGGSVPQHEYPEEHITICSTHL